ncbi:MAG: hypothetical protein R2747_12545 [Pyrinomonadaceae bacterium]
MPKKFDTNPLDPEFPERVRGRWAKEEPEAEKKTRRFPEYAEPDERTRRFDGANFTSYAPPADTGQAPAAYQTSALYQHPGEESSSRKVAKVGLPENILVALPYLPFSLIGLIAGILELIFVPKSEAKVRFHAAQGVAAHIGILIVTTILGFADVFTNLAGVASFIFWIVTTIMLLVFTYKAWKGEPVHIESVDGLTNWLEDKINPRV